MRFVPDDFMCQLEFPVGKVLFRERLIDNLRFSPDGRYLAFITHDNNSDDRGRAVILRASGEKVAESPVYESAQGLAWSTSGREIWFTSPLESGQIHVLTLSGGSGERLAVPGRLRLHDIARDATVLAEQGLARRGIIVSSNNGESIRDLSWLDFGYLRALSDDGKTILFEEEGSTTQSYTVFVRDVDGSPAIALGQGYGVALSHDKRWVLSHKIVEPTHEIWLLPVGPGQPRRLSPPNLRPGIGASFLSDDRRIIYIAQEQGHGFRSWMQDLNGGSPQPITPEGVVGFRLSPDEKWLLVIGLQAAAALRLPYLMPIAGGEPKEIPNLRPQDVILGWSSDNQLYVSTLDTKRASLRVDKLNPATGVRSSWRQFSGAPISGFIPDPQIFTPDGTTFAFDYRLRLADLYIISAVR